MELPEFSGKVESAANFLRALCSTGDPSEQQVEDVTRVAGLPVTFAGESFLCDPVRGAVFAKAYNPSSMTAKGTTTKQLIERAWRWHNMSQSAV